MESLCEIVAVGVFSPGKLMGQSDGLTELLHIPNSAKVVNIKDPLPGMWSIKVTVLTLTLHLKTESRTSYEVLWSDLRIFGDLVN